MRAPQGVDAYWTMRDLNQVGPLRFSKRRFENYLFLVIIFLFLLVGNILHIYHSSRLLSGKVRIYFTHGFYGNRLPHLRQNLAIGLLTVPQPRHISLADDDSTVATWGGAGLPGR